MLVCFELGAGLKASHRLVTSLPVDFGEWFNFDLVLPVPIGRLFRRGWVRAPRLPGWSAGVSVEVAGGNISCWTGIAWLEGVNGT